MVPEVGQRFGPYEILGKLGSGGMGLVFRAWDGRLHREVAIKLLHEDYTMPGMRERFLQEARAASALNHPNLCTVFDIGEQDHNPYLVMELLSGETLKDRIARGALPVEEIVRYTMEITDALTVAHARGVVHRDIKPANIFLVPMPNGKCQAKVLDFGLAKIELEERGGWESRTLDMTIAGSTVGTLSYMSPEQARGESLDLRTDLFSLGVVMYEMATRQVPFKGATSAMMMAQLFRHDPEKVTNWNDRIPQDLEKAILKLLVKDRRIRFQTAKELHDALEKIAEKMGRGGWLTKVTTPTVPLVRANDPVARHKTPKRRMDSESEESRGPRQPIAEGPWGGNDGMIRPMHVQGRGFGDVERLSIQGQRGGSVAVASGPRRAETHSIHGAASIVDAGGIDTAIDSRDEFFAGWTARSRVSAESLHRRTTTYGFLAENAEPIGEREEDRLDELIFASSAVGARVRVRMIIAAAMILSGVVLAAMVHNGVFRPLVLGTNDRLLLTVIQNKTGDKMLDGAVMQGLELALRQSRSLNLLGDKAYLAGQRQVTAESSETKPAPVQEVAQKLGSKAYVYGEIRKAGASYAIEVEVLKTDSNDRVATFEETARSREELPAAIGRMANDIRAELTQDSKGELQTSTPLEGDATTEVEALHAFAVGEAASQSGHTTEAMEAYQHAVDVDPKFVQAQMELAWLYRDEKAEVSAANAATLARNSSGSASDRVKQLVLFCYEMNVTADYAHAAETIRNFATRYPLDPEAMKGLARALMAQGLLPEALMAAQQGISQYPFDAEMYVEAQLALIGMDRFENARQMQVQAERAGLVMEQGSLVMAYLADREGAAATEQPVIDKVAHGLSQMNFGSLYDYGNYLDGAGKRSAGAAVWITAAARAASIRGLTSAEAAMLAQGALNRALTEDCTTALDLVNQAKPLPMGPVASFHAGMAAALCGDQPYADKIAGDMQYAYPQSNVVTQVYVPLLQATAQLGINEPVKALEQLSALSANDTTPIAPYLRGMAHAALGDAQNAILDFQAVQVHRGSAQLWGGPVYAMTEIDIARAYALERDRQSSHATYEKFLSVWKEADREQPLLMEALAKTPGH
jgi:serine/threonine protein kinase/tetratricopeptide (TPR) repeat protein